MTYATLHMNGKDFVLVPKARFRELVGQDERDARKVQRAVSALRAGKLRTVTHEQLKKRLGI
jgi:hypothetical protein